MKLAIFNDPLHKLDKILGILLVVSVFCLIFVLAHRSIFDLDLWLHLKTGEIILQNKAVPSHDLYSFTLNGKPWVDHEWLFQVVVYLVNSFFGPEGLISLGTSVIILSFIILFLAGYKAIDSLMEVSMLLIVVAYASISRFNIRPDIFSLVFFALYLVTLRFYSNRRIIWLFIPIQILWVNFHGYFFLGPLILFFYIFSEFLRRRLKFLPQGWQEESALEDSAYKRLKLVFVFTLLASFINPEWARGALYPVFIFREIISGKTKVFFKYIQELRPTFELNPQALKFYYMLIVLCFVSIALNFRKLKIVDLLFTCFFFLFALRLRNIVFFTFVTYIIIISNLSGHIKNWSENIKQMKAFKRGIFFLWKYGLAIICIAFVVSKTNEALLEGYYDFDSGKMKSALLGIDDKHYPKGPVDFVLANNITGNLFNDFNSGAYLIGRAYPKRKVFIDGRTELYGPDFFMDYQGLMNGDIPLIKKITDKYKIEGFVLSMRDSIPDIFMRIYKDPQWSLVFLDDTGVVFLKDTTSNAELIKKFKIEPDKYKVPQEDLKKLGLRKIYPAPYIKRARLFEALGEYDLVLKEAEEAHRIFPISSQAYYFKGKAYLYKKLYKQAFENLRASLLITPGNEEALIGLGISLMELKEFTFAKKTLAGLIKINPKYAPAYFYMGEIYLDEKKYTKAVQFLNKAIDFSKKKASYHLKLAEALFKKGKDKKKRSYIKEARSQLKLALELDIQKDLTKEINEMLSDVEKYLSTLK